MNQIKAGAVLNYIIIALNTLVGLAYTPYMIRCLGQNEYGLYSLVASVIAYLTILDFGFGNAIIRYTAKFRAENREQEQWEMFGMFLIVYSFIGIIAFCGGLLLYSNVDLLFEHTMTENEIRQAQVMMMLLTFNLAFTFPLSIFGSIISAYENFVFQRVVSIMRILLCTAVMIVVLAVGYKAIALVVVNTIFNLLTLVLNFFYCKRKLGIKIVFTKFDLTFLKEIIIFSFWIFLNAIMDRIYWGTGQFVLGAEIGTAAVAVFSIAIMLQQMYMQFSVSIVNVLLPRLTAMVANNSSDKQISDLFIKTGRIQGLIMSLILSGFIVFGKGFISKWAGEEYGGSYYISIIFFVALFIPLVQNVGINILQARNQMRFRSLLYLVISLASLGLQVLFSRLWGAVGCAFAVGLALIIGQGIIMNIYYQVKQKIDIVLFWKEIGKILIIPTILTFIGIILSSYINYGNLINMTVGIIVFTGIFVFLTWRFAMNDYEKNIVLGFIRR